MRLFKLFDRLIGKIPEPVSNVLNFLATILTILTAIGIPTGLFGFFSSSIEIESNNVIIQAEYIIILLCIMIILLVIRYVLFRRRYLVVQRELSEKCYTLLHEYRNEINQMEYYYKEIEKGDRTWDMAIFTKLVQEFLVKGLDCLCSSISIQSHGRIVCGCIKSIIPGSMEDISYSDATVRTFVRSTNSDSSRKSSDIDNPDCPKVFANTDFRSIIQGEETHNHDVFYRQDLIEYDKKLRKIGKQYDNTTSHWELRYKATIVAPIRIANSRLHYKSQNTKYDIIGFLCVDSLDTGIFTERQRENFTYLVKAYSAAFYNMMSKYQYYMLRFDEYEKNNKESINDHSNSSVQIPQQIGKNKQRKRSKKR